MTGVQTCALPIFLGRSLDELPPQTRRLLELLDGWVTKESERLKKGRADVRFTRKAVRDFTGWHNTQASIHLSRLVEMEYLLVHRGGRGQSFEYELVYEGQGKEGQPFCPGLIDVDSLASTSTSRGEAEEFPGSFRDQNGSLPGAFRGGDSAAPPAPEAAFLPLVAARFDEALLGGNGKVSSYPAEAAKEKSYRPRRYFLRGA